MNDRQNVSGWAVGGITFAAVMLIIIGTFEVIAGLTAIIDDDFYVVGRNYTFGLFTRSAWAGVGAIFFASLSAIANFFFIPYYPFWSIVVIALNVWVIWAVTRPGALDEV